MKKMNTIIIEKSGDVIAFIDKTSKYEWCWSWMERSVEEDTKKILKNSLRNGGLVTIFYKLTYERFINFHVFYCLRRPNIDLNYINLWIKGN